MRRIRRARCNCWTRWMNGAGSSGTPPRRASPSPLPPTKTKKRTKWNIEASGFVAFGSQAFSHSSRIDREDGASAFAPAGRAQAGLRIDREERLMQDVQSDSELSWQERRKYPRYEMTPRMSLAVQDLSANESIGFGEASDISLGGLRRRHSPPHTNAQIGRATV